MTTEVIVDPADSRRARKPPSTACWRSKHDAASTTSIETDGALILGAGIAGLFTALKLAPMPCIVLAGTRPGVSGSSAWAQGGIAAAVGEGDSWQSHAADTMAAGAGLCDPRHRRSGGARGAGPHRRPGAAWARPSTATPMARWRWAAKPPMPCPASCM